VLEQLNPMFRVLASRPAATPEQVREVELHFGHIPPDYRTLVGQVTELELHGGRIGRGRPGRVGGVLIESRRQVSYPLLTRDDDSQDGRLGFRWDGVPQRFGYRRVRAHTADSTSLLNKEVEPVNGYTWG
jgi:hypothetical protein